MCQKQNPIIQTLYAVAIGVTLVALALVGINLLPLTVAAQDPATDLANLSPTEKLALFGLTADALQSADVTTYNLQIVKQTNVLSVISGSPVTFTISITNLGPNPASYFVFYDNYPAQMKNVDFTFSAPAISGNLFNQQLWLFTNTLPLSSKIAVTVTGILTSASDVKIENTATATPLDPTSEISAANNTSKASVAITGYMRIKAVYLPVIIKNPPPEKLLAYLEDFNTGNPWPEFNSNGCKTDNTSGQYWVDVEANAASCLPPAKNENKPETPYRAYGEFEVTAYDNGENQDTDTQYGLFINGDGNPDYYFLSIKPNKSGCSSGGDWKLIRRHNSANTTLASGACHSAIKRGYGSGAVNKLVIRRKSNQLSVHINNTAVTTVTDTLNDQNNVGLGLYVAPDNTKVRIKFDNFTVYKFP